MRAGSDQHQHALAPVTAVIITKNEGAGIRRCVAAASFCDQVLVVDSESTDDTVGIATSLGAEVVSFVWNGRYPKKKQWGMDHPSVRNEWVLHLDADEIVSEDLRDEIRATTRSWREGDPVAFDVPLAYHFAGRELRHGHRVKKRSLVRKDRCTFPEIDDLAAPGITEVEGHYQPDVDGPVGLLQSKLTHDDPDPLRDWIARHNRYADWEAYLRVRPEARHRVRKSRSTQGNLFDRIPFKPVVFFLYSYVLRLGLLDGRAGFDYAFGLAWYYWLIDVKTHELRGRPSN